MKKILFVLVLLISLLFVSACSGSQGVSEEEEVIEPKGFYFKSKDIMMSPEAPSKEVTDALGEPIKYSEGNSCEYGGTANLYSYDGFVIETYQVDGVDTILSITINSDAVKTIEGITIGSKKSKLIEKYGDDYVEEAVYIAYKKDESAIMFTVEDDVVAEITYISAEKSMMF